MAYGIVILLLVIIFTLKGTTVIKQDELGLVERLGRYTKTLQPGLHFKVPLIDLVFVVSTKAKDYLSLTTAITDKDGKSGTIDIRVIARIVNPEKARYSVADLDQALPLAAKVKLLEILRSYSFTSLGIELPAIEETLKKYLSTMITDWGVSLETLKLSNFKIV